jgi:hypothetical protein
MIFCHGVVKILLLDVSLDRQEQCRSALTPIQSDYRETVCEQAS